MTSLKPGLLFSNNHRKIPNLILVTVTYLSGHSKIKYYNITLSFGQMQHVALCLYLLYFVMYHICNLTLLKLRMAATIGSKNNLARLILSKYSIFISQRTA